MTIIDRVYCDVAIKAALRANLHLGERAAEELLLPATLYTEEIKGDTLFLDAIPEIEISRQIEEFDPSITFFTEEKISKERKLEIPQDIVLQPVVFVSDPMDGSAILKEFLENLKPPQKNLKFKDLISQEEIREQWEKHASKQEILSGTHCGISVVKKGVPFVSVIINYITQYLFVSCELGNKMLRRSDPASAFESITLEQVFKEGEDILFNFKRRWDDSDNYNKFVTYLGKSGGYKENLENARIFLSDLSDPRAYLIPGIPWGPSRILYLSNLYEENPVGFIMANGEKITEWIHWLPYIEGARREGFPLQIFEIFFERPWTRDGILMATSRAYSIFVPDMKKERDLIDLAKIKDYPIPSRYRSTLLITFHENDRTIANMRLHGYRQLKFSF